MFKALRCSIFIAMIAGMTSARAEVIPADRSLREIPIGGFSKFTREQAERAGSYRVRAVVSSLARDGFVIGNIGNSNKENVFVRAHEGVIGGQGVKAGDEVILTGVSFWRNRRPSLAVGSVSVVGHRDEISLQSLRVKELNKGLYDLRRIAFEGEVVGVECYEEGGASVSLLTLLEQKRHYLVRVVGDLMGKSVVPGCRVRGIGHVQNEYDTSDRLLSVVIEVADADSLEVLGVSWTRLWRWTGWLLGALLLIAALIFLCLWVKARRERQILARLTKERIRLADELHDTVEQYVAGACLFLSGGAIDDAMRVLDEAKKNVGSVLDRLRGRGGEE